MSVWWRNFGNDPISLTTNRQFILWTNLLVLVFLFILFFRRIFLTLWWRWWRWGLLILFLRGRLRDVWTWKYDQFNLCHWQYLMVPVYDFKQHDTNLKKAKPCLYRSLWKWKVKVSCYMYSYLINHIRDIMGIFISLSLEFYLSDILKKIICHFR